VDETCERKKPRGKPLRGLIAMVFMGLAIAALVQELRKPAEQRTWHGRILRVPYDYRPPSLQRLREAYWNPEDSTIFQPRVMGVGWGVNFPALFKQLFEQD
jgi:hypothetical protein